MSTRQTKARHQTIVRGGTTSGAPGLSANAWNKWRENYNALAGLNIARVRALLDMVQQGNMAYPQWAYRFIERRHPVLKALIDCCEAPMENFEWDVRIKKQLPGYITESQAKRQQAKLKAAYSTINNLKAAIVHLAHAEFSGYAHLQKHYRDGRCFHLEPLHPYCICRDGLAGDWFWNPDSKSTTSPAASLGEGNRIGGKTLPREDFIIHESLRPINEIALENYVRRKLIEKDWSAFDEIFGIPSGVLIMPSGIPPEQVSKYEASAKAIAEGGTGAVPNGSSWVPNSPRADGAQPFKLHLAQLNEDLVSAGTGGKLKMLVDQGSGDKRGSASEQANTFYEIAQARGNKIGQTFHRDFDIPFLAFHFPDQPPLVEFHLVTKDDVVIGEICVNAATLKQAGKTVKTEWLANQTGYVFDKDDPSVAFGFKGKETI